MRAADPSLEHAPAPHWHTAFHGGIVDANCLGKAADAAYLDVDDPAGAHFGSRQRVPAVMD